LRLRALVAVAAALLAACGGSSSSSSTPAVKRVLLISVDGLHQVDVANHVAAHPDSTLAALASNGITYTGARTTTPSDSFPGLLALVTGGSPKTTGVYYDDSYDRTMFSPGDITCAAAPGAETTFAENLDYDLSKIFSGGINPDNLPRRLVDGECQVVWPHQFLQVNTVFEVVLASGGFTAWSDKHPAYELVSGPSGRGVVDLYTPEINSDPHTAGTVNGVNIAASIGTTVSTPGCNATNSILKSSSVDSSSLTDITYCTKTTEAYDDSKVQSIINQIDGKRSDGSGQQVVPTVFGMNFQAVSVGQKLTPCGYTDAAGTPSACLAEALTHTDASLGRIVAELKAKGLYDSTLIIVTAKHGQSPIDKTKVQMEIAGLGAVIDPADIISGVDPSFTNGGGGGGGFLMVDDGGPFWARTGANLTAITAALQGAVTQIHADVLPSGTVFTGTNGVIVGAQLKSLFGDPSVPGSLAAARAPDAFIQPNAGVIYSGSGKKRAEHGGGTVDDTAVALIVSRPSIAKTTVTDAVSTRQVAPTILKQLGLDPQQLQAVAAESTPVLPGL
jgi:hypothetical protein